MKKTNTTICLDPEMLDFVRTNDINLSKFVGDALCEHAGTQDKRDLIKLQDEIKAMKLKIAVKSAILKDLEEKDTRVKADEEKAREEAEKAKFRCEKCGNVLNDYELKNYKHWCKSHWDSSKYRILKERGEAK